MANVQTVNLGRGRGSPLTTLLALALLYPELRRRRQRGREEEQWERERREWEREDVAAQRQERARREGLLGEVRRGLAETQALTPGAVFGPGVGGGFGRRLRGAAERAGGRLGMWAPGPERYLRSPEFERTALELILSGGPDVRSLAGPGWAPGPAQQEQAWLREAGIVPRAGTLSPVQPLGAAPRRVLEEFGLEPGETFDPRYLPLLERMSTGSSIGEEAREQVRTALTAQIADLRQRRNEWAEAYIKEADPSARWWMDELDREIEPLLRQLLALPGPEQSAAEEGAEVPQPPAGYPGTAAYEHGRRMEVEEYRARPRTSTVVHISRGGGPGGEEPPRPTASRQDKIFSELRAYAGLQRPDAKESRDWEGMNAAERKALPDAQPRTRWQKMTQAERRSERRNAERLMAELAEAGIDPPFRLTGEPITDAFQDVPAAALGRYLTGRRRGARLQAFGAGAGRPAGAVDLAFSEAEARAVAEAMR